MKIGLYIPQLSRGGAERVLSNLAQFWSSNQLNEVIFITTVRSSNEYSLPCNVKRYVINEITSAKLRGLSRILVLRKICKNEQLDVLVSFLSGANIFSFWATLGLHTKLVLSVRNSPEKEYRTFFAKLHAKFLFRFVDGCVFQTNDAKSFFPKQLQEKSEIIYNPVSESFFCLDCCPQKGLVVAVGRLVPQKNHKLLIDAFGLVVKKCSYAQLDIWGTGPLFKELSDYIDHMGLKKSVFLCGETDDVQSVLQKAELFVLSSNFEGMPNALMEAMAVGVASISTDCPCGGPKELYGNSSSGILVEVGNVDQLTNEILRVLEDSEVRLALRNGARARAKDFLPNKILNKWDLYLKSIVK